MLNSVDANDSQNIGKFVDHTIFADFISLNFSTSEYSGLSIFACSSNCSMRAKSLCLPTLAAMAMMAIANPARSNGAPICAKQSAA